MARKNYSSLQTPNFRVNSRMELNKTDDPNSSMGGNPDVFLLGETHEATDFRLLFSSMLEYVVK